LQVHSAHMRPIATDAIWACVGHNRELAAAMRPFAISTAATWSFFIQCARLSWLSASCRGHCKHSALRRGWQSWDYCSPYAGAAVSRCCYVLKTKKRLQRQESSVVNILVYFISLTVTTLQWDKALYIGLQWRNFIPYLRQSVSAAILWVKLSEMFVCYCNIAWIWFVSKLLIIWAHS